MWKRLFIYLAILIVVGSTWAAVSNYGNASMDLDKTKMGLKSVNGNDADYASYQATMGGYTYLQTYIPWVSISVLALVTYLIWYKPAKGLIVKVKDRVSTSV